LKKKLGLAYLNLHRLKYKIKKKLKTYTGIIKVTSHTKFEEVRQVDHSNGMWLKPESKLKTKSRKSSCPFKKAPSPLQSCSKMSHLPTNNPNTRASVQHTLQA